jgi:hypothetical protein
VNEEAAVEELRAFQADLRTMLELERVLPHDYFKAPAWIEPNERVRQRMTLVLAIAEASEIPEAQENIRNGVDEVVPFVVEFEVAVPRLTPAFW